jgi:hypothetical protein
MRKRSFAAAASRVSQSAAIWILLVVSISLNVVQSHRLRAAGRGVEVDLRTGTAVPLVDGTSVTGESRQIRYGAGTLPTIVYFFNPRCGWCERNWDSLATLERATRGRYRLIAVTTAKPDDYRAWAAKLPVETMWRISEASRQAYRFSGTPHTLVVSPEGRVVTSWVGAYTGAAKTRVERFFRVSLPELRR